ncbi:unnamed protein product [Durusdinium trenchii]|uniref:Nucleotide-diphospho-sugar transferase domain-containing protein n=1 Tax=Durusdinium trenchii TaxID=1381693 RepID=A0ABP0RWF9_9DINO
MLGAINTAPMSTASMSMAPRAVPHSFMLRAKFSRWAAVHWSAGILLVSSRWRRSLAPIHLSRSRTGLVASRAHSSKPVGLHFFSDSNFKPLRDQFVNSVVDKDIKLNETIVEDLNVIKQRTAGGVPVYQFKTKLLMDALEDAESEEVMLISDVDIQFLGEVMPFVQQGIAGRDMCFQREFTKLGVNIGFVAIRRTPAAIDFWHHVWKELPSGRHDKRIVSDPCCRSADCFNHPWAHWIHEVNNLLYTNKVPNLRWGCFPPEIWASSQAFDGLTIPKEIALHHANWIIRDYSGDGGADASNPTAKLQQLSELRRAVQEESDIKQEEIAQRIREDPDLAIYHQRMPFDKGLLGDLSIQ